MSLIENIVFTPGCNKPNELDPCIGTFVNAVLLNEPMRHHAFIYMYIFNLQK